MDRKKQIEQENWTAARRHHESEDESWLRDLWAYISDKFYGHIFPWSWCQSAECSGRGTDGDTDRRDNTD